MSDVQKDGDAYDIYRVRGGFGIPFIKEVIETASSKQEADEIVAQYRKLWGNVYSKRRIAA